ncbi:DciA family protein [Aquihabitans daechungensis]|uniref:DciA family protein n=1 Tax=Aquihabitans daechungensis TaxID=1052257 RepID=UPI003B9E7EC6
MPWSKLPTSDGMGDEPDPATLPQLLDTVLAGMGAPKADAIIAIHEGWSTIVGDELAGHAQPLAVEDGCLRVGVDSPAWASHLRWSEREIVARVDRLVGAGVVTSVTTRILRR